MTQAHEMKPVRPDQTGNETFELIKETMTEVIRSVWYIAFYGPQAIQGRTNQIKITNNDKLMITLSKDHATVEYRGEQYEIDWWDVDEKGNIVVANPIFSSNWRSADFLLPKVVGLLTKHALQISQQVQF